MTSGNDQLSSAAPLPTSSTLAANAHVMMNTENIESPQAGKMRRNLTSSTQFTHSTSSDSLSDIAPCMDTIGCPLSPSSSDDDSSDDEDKNHLKRALESVGRKVQEWQLNQHREKQLKNEHMLQAAQREVEFAQSPEGIRLGQKRLYHLGEMGATLFSPIEGAFATSKDGHESNEPSTTETVETDDREDHQPQQSDSSRDEEDIDHFEIQVVPDDDEIPRLLSEHTMRKLMLAMPYTLYGRSWKRCFSITRDGDSFAAFRNGVKGYAHTLIVIQTTKGEILGGFADAAWEKGLGTIDGCFFGTGTSFLFSLRTLDKEDPIQIFRWQGVNEYSQLCRKGDGCVGMGGGGGCFGIFLQEDFTKGSSGACNTFGNTTPLTSSPLFDVLNLEVYGFERGW